jgi:protein required for attachment to host cells
MARNSGWFIVVDRGKGRLLRVGMLPAGRVHVDEVDAIEGPPDEHEHGRPSPRTARGGYTYASGGHETEQQIHRFAKEVAAWIGRKLEEHRIDRLDLFSSPRLLGELRKLYPATWDGRVREHQADLTHVTPAELSKHPAVADLLR